MDENVKNFISLSEEFYKKLNQARFELFDQKYVVKEYYRELRNEIQLAKEVKSLEMELNEQILDQIDGLIREINEFEINTIKIYDSQNNEETINEFTSKFDKLVLETSKYLTDKWNKNNFSIDNELANNMRDSLSKLSIERNNLKKFLFNGTQLRFVESRKNDDTDLKFGQLIEIDNDIGIFHRKINLGRRLGLPAGKFDKNRRLFSTNYECLNIQFLKNNNIVIHFRVNSIYKHPFQELIQIIDIKQMIEKKKLIINVIEEYTSSFTSSSDKICLLYHPEKENKIDLYESKKQEIKVLDENLNILCNIDEKKKKLIGSNESFLFFKGLKKCEKNKKIFIYNWSLEALIEIDQMINPEKSTYNIDKLTLNFGRYYALEIEKLRVYDQETGKLINTFETKDFLIDQNCNLILFGESIKYHSLNGDLIKEIKLDENLEDSKWFLDNNNNLSAYVENDIEDYCPSYFMHQYLLYMSLNKNDLN